MTIASDNEGPMFRKLEAARSRVLGDGNAITIFALDDGDWLEFKAELDKRTAVGLKSTVEGTSPHYKDIPVQKWTVSGNESSYSLKPLKSGTAGWKPL